MLTSPAPAASARSVADDLAPEFCPDETVSFTATAALPVASPRELVLIKWQAGMALLALPPTTDENGDNCVVGIKQPNLFLHGDREVVSVLKAG